MKIKFGKRFQLIIVIIFCQFCALSQRNFKDGYVVLKNNDTLVGKIDYRNWELNPLKIQFLHNGQVTVYTAAELLYFEVSGNDAYRAAIIAKDMRPADIATITAGIYSSDSTQIDTAFLRVLVKGSRLNLYELVDSRRHYFIQSGKDGKPGELHFWLSLNANDNTVQEKTLYKNQLAGFVAGAIDPSQVIAYINEGGYEEENLTRIVRMLNGADPAIEKSTTHVPKMPVRIMAGGGLTYFNFKFTGIQRKWTNLKFQPGIGPAVGIAANFFGNRNLHKIALRLACSYSHLVYNGAFNGTDLLNRTAEFKYRFVQNNIMPELGVLYHFLQQKSLKMYAGASIGVVFSSYPVNEYYTKIISTAEEDRSYNEIQFVQHWMSPNLMAGAMLWDKLNLNLLVKAAGQFIDDDRFHGKMFPVTLTVSYVFLSAH